MTNAALILGGSGRFGRNMAEALWNAGWTVELFDRAKDDLDQAAKGKDVIVFGWNPAYTDWTAQMPGLTKRVIAAAERAGATILVPGNIYVYGKQSPPILTPQTPHAAQNPLGRVRIDMERAFRVAETQVITLRAGDYLDSQASGNWFDRIIAPTLTKGRLTYPGNPTIPHSWAYLPDIARAAVELVKIREQLPKYSDISYPGYTLSGQELAVECGKALNTHITVKKMNWLPIRMARPFWRMAGALLEMQYLWNMPHQLSPNSLHAVLPEFRQTDMSQAIGIAVNAALSETSHPPKQADAHPSQVRAA